MSFDLELSTFSGRPVYVDSKPTWETAQLWSYRGAGFEFVPWVVYNSISPPGLRTKFNTNFLVHDSYHYEQNPFLIISQSYDCSYQCNHCQRWRSTAGRGATAHSEARKMHPRTRTTCASKTTSWDSQLLHDSFAVSWSRLTVITQEIARNCWCCNWNIGRRWSRYESACKLFNNLKRNQW